MIRANEFDLIPRANYALRAIGLAAFAVWYLCALAPEALGQSASTGGEATIESIVVTAEKQAQPITDVPMAITVLSGKLIEDNGLTSFEEYARLIPSLDFDAPNSGNMNVRLRGISANAGAPTVAFYINNTALQDNNSVTNPDPYLVDINRVEVLKGPQGNLYGASAMGGAIKIITNSPDPKAFAAVSDVSMASTIGGAGSQSLDGVLNVPLSNVVAARFSIGEKTDGGYVNLVPVFATAVPSTTVPNPTGAAFPENNINETRTFNFRGAVSYLGSEGLTINASVMTQTKDQDAFSDVDWIRGSNGKYSQVGSASNPEELRSFPEPIDDKFTLADLSIIYDFGPATITSTTSHFYREVYQARDYTSIVDAVLGPLTAASAATIPPFDAGRTNELYTQEVWFASKWDKPLNYFLGLYFNDQRGTTPQTWVSNSGQQAGFLPSNDLFVSYGRDDSKEFAVFGNLTLRLFENLELEAGGRWYDISSSGATIADGVFNGGLTNNESSAKATGYTPAFAANYHLTETTTLFARVAEGYRPGFGYTTVPVSCDAQLAQLGFSGAASQVGPDKVWSYELGTKYSTRQLFISAAAYWIDWTNIQTGVNLECGFGVTLNAGRAISRGAEVEWNYSPLEGVQFGGGIGYTNAELTNPGPLSQIAKPGDPLPGVPKFTAAAYGEYALPISIASATPYASGTYRFVDSRFTTYGAPTGFAYLPSGSVLDVAFGMRKNDWDATLFVDNVTNKEILESMDSFRGQTALTHYEVATGINRPRTVGIRLRTKFK